MFKLRFLVFSCSSPQIPNNTSCFPLNSCGVILRWFYFQNLTKKPISKLVVINLVGYSINIVKVSSGPENSTSPVNLTTGFDAGRVDILTPVMHFSCFYHVYSIISMTNRDLDSICVLLIETLLLQVREGAQ